MRESKVEKDVREYAEKLGWLVYKFTSPGHRGMPDRIFMRKGKVFFIEFKAPGEDVRPLQKRVIEKMLAAGMTVFVVDNVDDGLKILDGFEEC